MKWILLKADHRFEPPQVSTQEFAHEDHKVALAALREMEIGKPDYEEVVLFGAESVEALHESHSRYFYTAEEILENLRKRLYERLTPVT